LARVPSSTGSYASKVIDWFERTVVDPGRLPLFACLAAFVVTFLTTRGITRLIRAGRGPFKDNVSSTGVHVHHAVPGILLLVAGAFVAVAVDDESAWMVVAAIVVGTGTSLVLDEFALILRLQDVYWAEEGRVSVQIVGLASCTLGLAMLGLNPLGLNGDPSALGWLGTTVAIVTVLIHLSMLVVCVAKGRLTLALIGAFVPLLATVGALRLARPSSRWARRRYDEVKIERAKAREERRAARSGRWALRAGDIVAGAPSNPQPQ
jgi:hypothetical protein